MVELRRCARGRMSMLGVLSLAACGPAGDGAVPCGSLDPRNADEIALCNGLDQAVIASLSLPEGEPPAGGWPGVVVLHGSAGLFDPPDSGDEVCSQTPVDQFRLWASKLTDEGYAVLMPASFYSRGFCSAHKQSTVPRKLDDRENLVVRTFDAAAAADWLCDDPRVDCSKLGVLGFSNGASITMLLMLDDPSAVDDPRFGDIANSASLLGGAAYYPGCGLEQLLSSEIDGSELESYYFPYAPLWVPHAERDRLLDRCEEVRDPQVDMIAELHGVSEDRFELEVYAAAKHGFDVWHTGDPQADLDARTAAEAQTLARFEAWLK